MPTSSAQPLLHFDPHWDPGHPAVWCARSPAPDAEPGTRSAPVTLLRHGSYPFCATLQVPRAQRTARWLPSDQTLNDLARHYVDQVARLAELPDDVVQALGTAGRGQVPAVGALGWLPITWGAAGLQHEAERDPRGAFWVLRRQGRAVLDRTAVLLAARQVQGQSGPPLGIGGDVGLRVVVLVDAPDAHGTARLRISGASMSRLGSPAARHALPADLVRALADHQDAAIEQVVAQLAVDLGLAPGLVIQGLRTGQSQPTGTVRVHGEGRSPRDLTLGNRHHAFVADVDAATGQLRHLLSLTERVSGAAAETDTPLPTAPQLLQRWMDTATLPPSVLAQPPAALAIPAHRADDTPPASTAGPARPLRSTARASAAASPDADLDATNNAVALWRTKALLDRLDAFGLAAADYFKLARAPLQVHSRASMPGAGDGVAINAEVRPSAAGLSSCKPWRNPAGTDLRPQLALRFGVADLQHRWHRYGADGRLVDTQYLGLAIDPSWAWHEFAHVLAYASTGELEFRFAHSAGDGMAAIAIDPDSPLADDPEARFRSFPVVALPRRHDRAADLGWCWCGRRSPVRLGHLARQPDRRLGYFEEQLLSTSLFRLYRSLGGDTPGDEGWAQRRSASEYSLYLIMRAIALLGPDHLVPALGADHFVSALIDADLGTGDWQVDVSGGPGGGTTTLHRRGGLVHKPIRWAFEAQGLYATEQPHDTAEGPGQPPPVDLYIADRRPAADGGYTPVALRWDVDQPQGWHAAPAALACNPQGRIEVAVANRGRLIAAGTTVRAWACLSPDPGAARPGAARRWVPLVADPTQTAVLDVEPWAGSAPFRFLPPAGAGSAPSRHWWVLAAATCAADPDNLGPGASPPPPTAQSDLLPLVAHDNNLALARLLL